MPCYVPVLCCMDCTLLLFPMQVSHMKQCAEDMELKLQGNVQSVVYSGIKNIVKTTSGKTNNQLIVCATGHFTVTVFIWNFIHWKTDFLCLWSQRDNRKPQVLEWLGPADRCAAVPQRGALPCLAALWLDQQGDRHRCGELPAITGTGTRVGAGGCCRSVQPGHPAGNPDPQQGSHGRERWAFRDERKVRESNLIRGDTLDRLHNCTCIKYM